MQVIKFYERGQDNPDNLTIQWNLGNVCNYACSYCPSYLHDNTITWPDLETIIDVLQKIKSKFYNKKITVELLGGEITLYKHFISLMKFLKEESFNSNILSNGSRSIRFWQEVVPYLDNIGLSYHPEYAISNNFINTIQLLTNNGVNPYIKIAMVKNKFWELVDFQKKLLDLFPHIRAEMVLLIDKQHQHSYNGYYYNYSKDEFDYLVEHEDVIGHLVAEYDNGTSENLTLNQVRNLNLNNFKGFECGSKLSLITIDHKGNVSTSLCRQRPRISIYKIDTELDSLLKPVICEMNKCINHSDLRILKENVSTR